MSCLGEGGEPAISPSSRCPYVLPGSLLSFVATAMRDPSVDAAKLESLLRTKREVIANDARDTEAIGVLSSGGPEDGHGEAVGASPHDRTLWPGRMKTLVQAYER